MRMRALAFCLSTLVATSASAQGLMADMHGDVSAVQKKFLDLAQAIPESAYSWRPPGARSIGEVLLHIAVDNYFLVIPMGKPAPAAANIDAADFKTLAAFEKRQLSKAQIISELESSFKHLHEGMNLTTDSNLNETIKFFGQDVSRRRAMLGTVTHMHEHLGQLIAYARSNNVTPPWSRAATD